MPSDAPRKTQLFGRAWTRRELEARFGRLEQVAGIARFRREEGAERDVEAIRVRTGAGLSYEVLASRALDISLAEFCGSAISWQAQNGDVHPAYFRAEGFGFLRTAAGGLLMTCGLRQAGFPCVDDGEELGLHGRAHHTPASEVTATTEWRGDQCVFSVTGIMREARIFGENLTLRRRIESTLGENGLRITDTIRNEGFDPEPLMTLYHFNFGFPLMDDETRMIFPSRNVVPREQETPLQDHDRWCAPQHPFRERVYYHSDLRREPGGLTTRACIENPLFPLAGRRAPLGLALRWSTANLPQFVQWKQPGASTHVLGIEPSNCFVAGRKGSRENGTLKFLAPGEEIVNTFEIVLYEPGARDALPVLEA